MILVTTFLMNVLCALVPCPPQFPGPEISENNVFTDSGDGVRKLRNIDNSSTDPDYLLNVLETEPRVQLPLGELEGYFMKTVGGRNIYAFEGIPYAEAPVGSRRFQVIIHLRRKVTCILQDYIIQDPPVPKRPWKQLLQAKRVSSECLQYNPFRGFRVTGNEDCLFLNVYTPKIHFDRRQEKLPVIVFIHGGFYNFGTGGEYGPAYLLEKNVVLITINYRLGVLGFLSTNDKFAPGNNGLRDQALAMKWASENVDYFGGDRNRITALGFSAGASSVHLHMLNNSTKDYFQQAISISGNAFNPWSLLPVQDVQQATRLIAEIFQCPSTDSKQMVECLRRQSSASLVARQSALFPKWPYPYVLFGPVVDGFPGNVDPIIPVSPEDAYKSGSVRNISWIATMTKQEGHFALIFPTLMGRIPTLRRQWRTIAPELLVYAKETNITEITRKITDYYFGHVSPLDAPLNSFSEVYTDRHFGNSLHQALQAHSKIAPTYAYVFDYTGKYNLGNLIGFRQHEWGVGHAEDTFYYFNSSSSYTGFKKTDAEFKLSSIMVNLICNFVRGGVPLYSLENATTWNIWDKIKDAKNMTFLQLSEEIKMVPEPHQERIKFWEDLNLSPLISSQL